MLKQHNILQYEFFHVGGHSLGAILSERRARSAEHLPLALSGDDTGSGIKTVVRLYDVDGHVTRAVTRIVELEQKRDEYYVAPSKGYLIDWYRKWQLNKIRREIKQTRSVLVGCFVTYLERAFKDGWDIAREIGGFQFRLARRDEYPDLLQASKRSKGLWLFIFEPNDLLAVTNKSVVSLL